MNNQLQQFVRDNLKASLVMLPESHQMLFKRMYSHKDLDADINVVVDRLNSEKLDFAMQQVQLSLGMQQVQLSLDKLK